MPAIDTKSKGLDVIASNKYTLKSIKSKFFTVMRIIHGNDYMYQVRTSTRNLHI